MTVSDPVEVIYTPDIFYRQRVGGISRYFVELGTHLHRAGQRPAYAAGIHRNEHLRRSAVTTYGCYFPFGIGPLHYPRVWFNHVLCGQVARRHPRAVIHQTYYGETKYPGRHRVVMTVYDLIHELFEHRFPELRNDLARSERRAACLRAEHLIAISATTKNDLVRVFGVDPARISVIDLASSLPVAASGQESPGAAAPAGSGNDEYLLYVGARSAYKNFGTLLEAFADSPALRQRFRLVCFGGGPFNAREWRHLARLKLTGRVEQRSGDDLALVRCYRGATALVCPSLYEGFGLPVLEAMSNGCPVLCSRAGSLPEVAGDAAAYFDPDSAGSIRTVLETTLADDFRQQSLRDLGRARAQLFSWERCARETLEVYRRLATP